MSESTAHTATTPYHRDWNNTTRTTAIALLQQSSGELWGAVPQNGGAFRCVQAYRHPVKPADRGMEFNTSIPPTAGTGTPWEARWVYCDPGAPKCTPAVTVNQQGSAVIPISVTRIAP
jgi:hypothetical protein